MEIPRFELVSKHSKDNNISTENIFGNSFDLKASELSFESRLSEDLKSRESTGDVERDDTREIVCHSKLCLSTIGCNELKVSTQESEVYFQKITASVVFPEDYKCRLRRKKCDFDCHIEDIFGEKEEKYSKLIAEAKKRQRCGPCLTGDKCSCGDVNILRTIEPKIAARPKVVETLTAQPNLEKTNKIKMRVRRKIGKPTKKVDNSELSKQKELDDGKHKIIHDERDLRQDSLILTKERILAEIDRPEVQSLSQNDKNTEETHSFNLNSKHVSINSSPPKMIAETVPDAKTTSFRIRLKTKPKSCPARCTRPHTSPSISKFQKISEKRSRRMCNGCNTYRANRRKVMKDVASCNSMQDLKDVSTNTKSMIITINCKSTQTCCQGIRRLTDTKPKIKYRTIGLDPMDEVEECDKAKLLSVLDDLINEFEKQYEEEKKRCGKRKKKKPCPCRTLDNHARTNRQNQNCTYAYLTMMQPYMQYETLLPVKKSYIECTNDKNHSSRFDQNKNLLKFLALKQKQFSCFHCDLKRNFTLTEDDALRLNTEFCDFLVQNKTK